tara:strand:- start:677 stop:1354 length:678 start_codon:yes stop_codon:yes gene_type:complete
MWEDIIKNRKVKPHPFAARRKVIDFMNDLINEVLDKIEAKEGKHPYDLTDGAGGSSLRGYYYTPNYVLECFPLVGYHEGRGFVVEFDSVDKTETYADWHDLWGYGFGEVIDDIADKFGEEYRLKEEDKEVYPVIHYVAGADDYENSTFALYCKQEDAWAEALMEDVNQKLIDEYGEAEGKSMYEPEFPMAYDPNTGKNITAEEAINQDERNRNREDWKDSLRGQE